MTIVNPFDFFLDSHASEYPFDYGTESRRELDSYLAKQSCGPKFAEFLAQAPRKHASTVDFLVDLNRYVNQAVKYVIRLEPGVQSCDETLSLRARFVSRFRMAAGAVITAPGPRRSLRLRLSAATNARRQIAQQPLSSQRFKLRTCMHGPKSFFRARLGRPGSDFRTPGRRRASTFGGNCRAVECCTDHRRGRRMPMRFLVSAVRFDECMKTHLAVHEALHG